jgi:hypothetical protein
MGLMFLYPGWKVVLSVMEHRALPDDPWFYGLLGLGAFLVMIRDVLDGVRSELCSMTFVLYQVLKDPETEEEAISLATYRRLRERLGIE